MGEARRVAGLAKQASKRLSRTSAKERNDALLAMAKALEVNMKRILDANNKDVCAAKASNTSVALIDRLLLNETRINDMANALRDIASQKDLLGEVVSGHISADGLKIEQVRVPLGVLAMIYEARPNVTSDACGLAIKTGNACVLRGGSLAQNSNIELTKILSDALVKAGLPENSVVSIESTDRAETEELMTLTGLIDVLIPRGGKGLIRSCVENAKVPVIETGAGNCHIYLQNGCDIDMAKRIVVNAKTQRPGVCNAVESLLVDRDYAGEVLPGILDELINTYNVAVYADEHVQEACKNFNLEKATEEDYATEYLDLKISVATVNDINEAIAHINTYGSGHSEAIVTKDYSSAERFLNEVDASSVYVNASTRFTDGAVFGLGAEIGISTQKLHARGPMGAKALTTTKYCIRGDGNIRE